MWVSEEGDIHALGHIYGHDDDTCVSETPPRREYYPWNRYGYGLISGEDYDRLDKVAESGVNYVTVVVSTERGDLNVQFMLQGLEEIPCDCGMGCDRNLTEFKRLLAKMPDNEFRIPAIVDYDHSGFVYATSIDSIRVGCYIGANTTFITAHYTQGEQFTWAITAKNVISITSKFVANTSGYYMPHVE
jgi:hypothetical protein